MSWVLTECDDISYYQCQALNNSQIVQGFTTQKAGNMAFHTGDELQKVKERHNRFLHCLDLNPQGLIAANQVHGSRIAVVDSTSIGRGVSTLADLIPETDALITRDHGVTLSIVTADCLPIFLYDPLTPAIGIVHAGWRGTLAGIAGLTLAKMVETFGTDPNFCRAEIGPGICGKCFQVSAELADDFYKVSPEAVFETESALSVDLAYFNRLVLEKSGIPEELINQANICTCCQSKYLFSYRASKTTGRSMGIIALK